MEDSRMEKTILCWTFVKVVALVSLILCSAYFAVWTYQSIERLQAKNDCLEGRLGVLGLLNRNNVNVRMLKGDTGDWVGVVGRTVLKYLIN